MKLESSLLLSAATQTSVGWRQRGCGQPVTLESESARESETVLVWRWLLWLWLWSAAGLLQERSCRRNAIMYLGNRIENPFT